MRLPLVHQLVLLLVAAVLLAVTALGAVVAWNLRAGFSDYLRAQDEAWLERFAEVAAVKVAQSGLGALSGPPGTLRPLLDAAGSVSNGAGGPEPPRAGPGLDEGPDERTGRRADPRPWDRPGPRPEGRPDERPRPPREQPPPHRYGDRLTVVAPEGRLLAGRPPPPGMPLIERPIRVQGQWVATARLGRGAPAAEGIDAAFLARQYRGIVIAAGLLLALAVAGAVWVGRRWLRPVRDAQHAARRIAEGAFDVRVAPHGNNELTDLAHDINAMAASLQQLESSRRRWIAELSHEMRTPLAILRAEVECLVDGIRPLDAAALDSLQGEVMRLSQLVDDFHQLALSDLRALPCSFAPLQPAQLAREAVARVAPRAAAAGLALSCECQAAPALAHWDRQRIDQLLSNLLENSLRYTDAPGRVSLAVGTGDAGEATITLDDSAPGVPAGDLPRLFEPLYRADASRSRRSGGSGLGLAICRAIVHSHGGRIEARLSPLGGLRIVATLPQQPREGV